MKKLVLLFFLVLCSSISLAQLGPPQTNVNTLVGLQIEHPGYAYYSLNSNPTLHFHIFNVANGLPVDNTTIMCYIHIYNSTGNHIIQANVTDFDSPYDFEYQITSSDLQGVGMYEYIFQCNNATHGGFISEGLTITRDGVAAESNNNFLFISTMFLLLAILSYIGIAVVRSNAIKLYLALPASLFTMLMFYFAKEFLNISNPTSTGLLNVMDMLFISSMVMVFPILTLVFCYTVYQLVQIFFNPRRKSDQQWGNYD